MASKAINQGLLWALTDDAREALYVMTNSGLDFDIAFAILEAEWAEDDLYAEFPEEPDHDEVVGGSDSGFGEDETA